MYDLSFHARWLLVAVFFALPCCSSGLSAIDTASAAARKERNIGLLVAREPIVRTTLDAHGQAFLAEGIAGDEKDENEDQVKLHLLRNTSKDLIRIQAQYYLHNGDGMKFTEMVPTGTTSGEGFTCGGITNCQFKTFIEARTFCNDHMACNGILQETKEVESGCDGGLGCFFPAKGHLQGDDNWRYALGKTYERQVLAYERFVDGRKLNDVFDVGTRNCQGVHYCQYAALTPALDFCDMDADCLGVMKMPNNEAHNETACKGGKGCYTPARGSLFHDPVWRAAAAETYLKEQEVAYSLRDGDGMIYDGRFAAGTSGCHGVHNCQFMTLETAEAYCDANPTCKGVIKKFAGESTGEACGNGLGCFEPVKGNLTYDATWLVTEGKLFERRMVR